MKTMFRIGSTRHAWTYGNACRLMSRRRDSAIASAHQGTQLVGAHQLLNDLARREAPDQSHRSRRAERAGHLAAHLGRRGWRRHLKQRPPKGRARNHK